MDVKDFEIENIVKQTINDANQIISCKNYIGTFYDKNINIYKLDDNLDIMEINKISSKNIILGIDFNYKYKDILLSVPINENMKIYKILSNKKPEVVCELKGDSSIITNKAKFNPCYENIIVSYEPNTIDFWDINK